MSTFTSIIVSLTLISTVFASDALEVDSSSCGIKTKAGKYTYDPTSGSGPEDWGSIDGEFEMCGKGEYQSPINFPSKVLYAPHEDGPEPKLESSEFTFTPSSFNWAVTCATEETCGYTMFGGKKYYYLNSHFHSPSEHTLNGKRYPMESHMVHKSEDGDLAVISTMYQYPGDGDYSSLVYAGAHMDYGINPFLQEVLIGVKEDKGTFKISPNLVVKADKGFCVYTGSLTTPPCSEGVIFMMQMNVETVSRRQVHDYAITSGAPYDGNARPVQPLHGREVTCYV